MIREKGSSGGGLVSEAHPKLGKANLVDMIK